MTKNSTYLASIVFVASVTVVGICLAQGHDPACENRGDYPYGWNPISKTSCRLDVSGSCIDTDGDGWGWDGQASCRMDTGLFPEPPAPCMNNDFATDPDGDGYGWENNETCIVTRTCIDSDGDGWGWDGAASCRTENTQPDVEYTITVPNGQKIQTVPGPFTGIDDFNNTEWACDDYYWYSSQDIWYYPSSNAGTSFQFNADGTGYIYYYRLAGDGAITWEWTDFGVLITSGYNGPEYGGLNLFSVNNHPEISYWIEEERQFNGELRTVYRAVETGLGYYSGGRVCWRE